MSLVTFDSNVWRPVAAPHRFPKDPMNPAFVLISQAIASGQVDARLSETVFTLEAIASVDRKAFLAQYKAKVSISEKELADGRISLGLSIAPDAQAHPGNTAFLTSHLKDALTLNFRLMRCPRIAGIVNPDLKDEWFAKDTKDPNARANVFGEVTRKIEVAGTGLATLKQLGEQYVAHGETWFDALAKAPASEDGVIAKAVAEWADGDSVGAHVAYGNHFFCTRDLGMAGGNTSVLAPNNRVWLSKDYGVQFVTPDELGKTLH